MYTKEDTSGRMNKNYHQNWIAIYKVKTDYHITVFSVPDKIHNITFTVVVDKCIFPIYNNEINNKEPDKNNLLKY